MEQWVEKLWKQESAHSLPTLVLTEVSACCGLVSRLAGYCFAGAQAQTQSDKTRQHPRVEDERAAQLWEGQLAEAAEGFPMTKF